jgi:bacillithiol biosynthesis cysteine-adding enzyme BshC
VTQEIACPDSNGSVILRTESIPFSEIPGQSALFRQYQSDPLSLKKFYPSAVATHTQIADRIPEVLANHTVDRGAVCDALGEINRAIGSGDKTFENIKLLSDPECVAVVTGQQAGLFTGPLYTVYKALSAVRAAECLRGRGYKAVPVFWAATEDHDFEEVSKAFVIGRDSELVEIIAAPAHTDGIPVGDVSIDDSITSKIDQLVDALKPTEFTGELRAIIEDSYTSGASFGAGFESMLAAITHRFGLVFIDPLNAKLKQLSSTIYKQAIERSDEIVAALTSRDHELLAAGFTPQVAVEKDYFPLFWHADDGRRLSLRNNGDGQYRVKAERTILSREQLIDIAENDPSRLSPSVVLRPVVQDYLLPTVCYFGGGAEISYFAQNSEVYRVLERPVTTILHRQSFTVVEAKHSRTLSRYGRSFDDLFAGLDELLPQIVEQHLDPATAQTFAEVEEMINTQLNRLDRELSAIDPTLAQNLATRRRKILYHIAALRRKFQVVEMQKDETVNRRVLSLFTSLLPHGSLQERTINVSYFIDRHGTHFIDWIYSAIDLDDKGHRVIYL